MPSRVQASTSMWGWTLRWLISRRCGQALEERRADRGALADEDEGLGVAQALGEDVVVLDVIGPDRDLVGRELGEAVRVRSVSK